MSPMEPPPECRYAVTTTAASPASAVNPLTATALRSELRKTSCCSDVPELDRTGQRQGLKLSRAPDDGFAAPDGVIGGLFEVLECRLATPTPRRGDVPVADSPGSVCVVPERALVESALHAAGEGGQKVAANPGFDGVGGHVDARVSGVMAEPAERQRPVMAVDVVAGAAHHGVAAAGGFVFGDEFGVVGEYVEKFVDEAAVHQVDVSRQSAAHGFSGLQAGEPGLGVGHRCVLSGRNGVAGQHDSSDPVGLRVQRSRRSNASSDNRIRLGSRRPMPTAIRVGHPGMTVPRSWSRASIPMRATSRGSTYMNFGIAKAVSATPAALRNSVRTGPGAMVAMVTPVPVSSLRSPSPYV